MRHRKGWILLAEDETDLASVIQEILEGEGFGVIHSNKVRDLITKLQNQAFDLLLFDLRLLDGNSERVIDQMRSYEGELNHKTPIIVMSAHMDRKILERLQSKITSAILKPFDVGKLIETVKKTIQAKKILESKEEELKLRSN